MNEDITDHLPILLSINDTDLLNINFNTYITRRDLRKFSVYNFNFDLYVKLVNF